MTYLPPPAEELRFLDAELRRLDAHRAQLLARRAWLVSLLQSAAPGPAAPPFTGPAPATVPRPEASAPRVQNVLLVLGGALLTIAAMAFTLVSWGHLGIAGRAAVLGTVTAAALAAPVPLLRRGLRSTAESVAGLGLALTVLDAYALHEAALADTDGTAYAAVAATVLAGAWAAYGTALGALRLPRPAALAAAQLPLLLTALAADAGPYGISAALLLTATADAAAALLATSPALRPVRVAAAIGAYGTGGWGLLGALWLSWTAPGPGAAARAAALLLPASAVAVTAAWRTAGTADPGTTGATSTTGVTDTTGVTGTTGSAGATSTTGPTHAPAAPGTPSPALPALPAQPLTTTLPTATALLGILVLLAALGGVLRVTLPGGWAVPGELLGALALLAALRVPGMPERVRLGVAWASAAVQGIALLWALPLVAVALFGPFGWADRPWSGGPADARDAVTVHAPWLSHSGPALAVLGLLAGALALLVRNAAWRPRALAGAAVLAWAAALSLPAALELPYVAGLLVLVLLTAAVLALPVLPPTGTVLALVTSVDLAFLALADRTATLTVLSALTVLYAATSTRPRFAPVTAPAALAHATALACATGAAAGWQPPHTALLVLAVPAVAVAVAPRLATTARGACEVTGVVAALVAVGLAVTDAPVLALVLSSLGVLAAATAVRPDRRSAGYAAAALFALAAWVRLAAWEVTALEAYTLPVTVPALLVGAWRRRRDPLTGSWAAYGPGLAVTLLPSLAALWRDEGWPRPLLLGSAALLVTLLGARHRLRAPLVLGGAVLVLTALHELAPYLVQFADALPRWVPPALAGLLLLALGATYERRLRDVRRVRDVLGRMS
ncbi:SCO7613 C-terminal domain-containing membrane protein [Streptomyces longwoodensis]|uniref:SCO7613 C-terminal domain-containing membrane protein n=1 Tax=Streptomyces longwoodensis TaxID=68231 RepID=UPI0036DFAF40